MFRFLHAADIHLDSPLRGLSRYETAPVEAIRGATRRAFVNLVDLAIKESVAFVLLAGDLYDGDWRDFSTGVFVSQQLGRLQQHDIGVLVVAGNHDAQSKITKELALPANITFFPTAEPATVRLEKLQVAVHGQGFATPRVDTNLAAEFPAAVPDYFNIGLLHTSLDGRQGHANYAPCKLDDLRAKGYQYWALGHVHQREEVSVDPWVVFAGCTQGRHARETGPKGCTLVTVQDAEVMAVEQRHLDVVRWVESPVDLRECTLRREVMQRVRETISTALAGADGRLLCMRVRLEGATPIADEIAAFPDRLEAEVHALAAELADQELWIERVELAVTRQRSLEDALAADDVSSGLLEQLLALPLQPGADDGVKELIDELRKKLVREAIGPQTGLELDDPAYVGRLLAAARQMLVGRLLEKGGGQ